VTFDQYHEDGHLNASRAEFILFDICALKHQSFGVTLEAVWFPLVAFFLCARPDCWTGFQHGHWNCGFDYLQQHSRQLLGAKDKLSGGSSEQALSLAAV
jgi:hypothetical protein